jgi:hypothetical protein
MAPRRENEPAGSRELLSPGTSGPGAPFGGYQGRCPDPPSGRDRGLAIAFDPNEVLRLLANNLGYYATTEIVVTLKLY